MIDAKDIARAADLLHDVVAPTPLEYSRWLSELVGGDVFRKCENLQRTGSFKLRGAYVRMARLSKRERARGVVAASAGNHAQGVALAAQLLGIKATVFMPHGAPIPKEKRDPRVRRRDPLRRDVDRRLPAGGAAFEAETGAVLIHPFDHPDIVAGQATAGLEIVEQCPQVRTVVVPTGGGGLVAGIACAMQRDGLPIEVIGVQAAGAAAYPASLAAGGAGPAGRDVDDGGRDRGRVAGGRCRSRRSSRTSGRCGRSARIRCPRPSCWCWNARSWWSNRPAPPRWPPYWTSRRGSSRRSSQCCRRQHRPDPADAGDPARYGGGRYLSLRVRIPDTPGGLATLLTQLATLDANLIEVLHERISETLNLDEVEVALQLELRGEEHRERVLASLTGNGYTYTLN